MRVLIVNSHGGDTAYGGAERYVATLRNGLESRGHSCRVLSAYPVRDGRRDGLATLHDTDWRDDHARRIADHLQGWSASPTIRLRQAIAAAAPDIVHTNNLFGISTGIWECARSMGIPVVHTLHDYGLLCPRTTMRRRDGAPCPPAPVMCGLRTRRLARWAGSVALVIGVSDHVLARHGSFFAGVERARVIRAPLSASRAARAVGPDAGRPRVLGYVGRLSLEKGIMTLLRAAAGLARIGVAVRIAGDGPLRGRVAVTPGVDYVGRLDDDELPAFVLGCDLGVVPSLWDEPGLSYAALEWLGAGRPVLTSGRGGLRELPHDGTARFDGGVDGLVAHVRELSRPDVWNHLTGAASILADRAATGIEEAAWIDAHLRVYDRVRR